ncbi:hypothetical protein EJA72_06130 [Pseudomonas sp. PB120]|uniref:hypothetical protein n=1 Tax=Pseudomonas sp. PB120 TaxID=2494700 RepID=UPI0012FE56F2|nr:hypothetical protein [Pseudomonas sp. PB120]MVV47827.1 hypothetical protein [Pseudomonas sp. PB120]
MINKTLSSLLLAGLLSAVAVGTWAASDDGADATGTHSGAISGSTLSPNNNPGTPSVGHDSRGDNRGSGSSSGGIGNSGGTSGSGAGGGTGAAGGGTGGAGGGTGSWTRKSNP